MSIVQESVVDIIEINANHVGVRFLLLVTKDGVELSRKYHRTVIEPDVENAAVLQMYAVNAHLVAMGEAPVAQPAIDRIVAFVALAKVQK